MRLVLARHGETVWNREGRIQGHNHGSLTRRGRRQAAVLAGALRTLNPTTVYASPVRRAWETAEVIAESCGLTPIPVEALMEVDVGELDGLKPEEMKELYPEFAERWSQDATTAVMPGGESIAQMHKRVWHTTMEMLERHIGETLILVSHCLAIQSLLCGVLGMPLHGFGYFQLGVGAFSVVEFKNGGPVLTRHNDSCHLDRLDLVHVE